MMYQRFFEDSLKKHPSWTKAHHLAHARRVTVKLFLAHWHTVGRALQGLPVRKPYICDKQPHQCIPPVLDTEDPAVIQSFYDLVLKPLGWWTEREYYDWVTALKISHKHFPRGKAVYKLKARDTLQAIETMNSTRYMRAVLILKPGAILRADALLKPG